MLIWRLEMNERSVRWFFVAVGVFYLLNFIGLLPGLSEPLLTVMYPEAGLPVGGGGSSLLQDAWAVIGAQLGAIGVVALWGAREPRRYAAVIPVVIAVEVFDAFWDIYSIVFSGEALWFGLTTLFIHIVWIVWAYAAWVGLSARSPQVQ